MRIFFCCQPDGNAKLVKLIGGELEVCHHEVRVDSHQMKA